MLLPLLRGESVLFSERDVHPCSRCVLLTFIANFVIARHKDGGHRKNYFTSAKLYVLTVIVMAFYCSGGSN